MRASSLFPDEELPIQPVADRPHPPLWVRRLVVVTGRNVDAQIVREVTFRPGLNVVRVAEHSAEEIGPVGHSVGKTLLTRLIRYCLGERYFADTSVLSRIAQILPGAYVIAEITAAGQNWVVSRPLSDKSLSDSFAKSSMDWRSGLNEPGDLQPYTDFLESISQATLAALPALELPEAGRQARWLDLMAWLARDQECSYRHYNEWRDPDANSGTARLHRDDASLLIRWGMDLLDAEEIALIAEHTILLRDLGEAKKDHERKTASLTVLKDRLRSKLGLVNQELPEAFFIQKARRVAQEKIQSLERLQKEFEEDESVSRLHDEVVRVAEDQGAVRSEMDRFRAMRQETQGELKLVRESSSADLYAKFDPDRNCPLDRGDCPRNPHTTQNDASDPHRETRIAKLTELLSRCDNEIARREERLDQLQEERTQCQRRYAQESRSQRTNASGNQSQIDRFRELLAEVEQCERDIAECSRAGRRSDQLDGKIARSLRKQETSRGQKRRLHQELSRYFDWTLKRLLGPDASGEIRLDARGLHPAPSISVRANGIALSTLSTVLGLDLACLTASICGIGRMPPFLIHDSPKEADMEPVLYNRLFTLAFELEQFYRGRQPAFQYILTTTSPPPDQVLKDPYTRLILDARVPEGHLLGRRF